MKWLVLCSLGLATLGCDRPVPLDPSVPVGELTEAARALPLAPPTNDGISAPSSSAPTTTVTCEGECGSATDCEAIYGAPAQCKIWRCTGTSCNKFCSQGNAVGACSSDGNPCTNDTCSNGSCVHIAYTVATTCPDDGNPCTSDVCSGTSCVHPAVGDGTGCNKDSSLCTNPDTCQGGVCTAGPTVNCTAKECNTVACAPATGLCVYTPVGGTPVCGGICSMAGTCSAGTCSGGSPKNCTTADDQCNVGVCNPATALGDCEKNPRPNGTACTPVDKCLLTTSCQGGVCSGTPKVCTPPNVCKTSACDSATGNCVDTNKTDGIACDVQNDCVVDPKCANGQCTGTPLQDGTPCNKEGCTIGSACVAGACACTPDDLGTGEEPDLGVTDDASVGGGGGGDMTVVNPKTTSCSMGGGHPLGGGVGLLLGCVALLAWRRRRDA
jgi:hypothetical protein